MKFHSPRSRGGDEYGPTNVLGIRHVGFVVDDIDAAVDAVRARRGELVGEVENHEDVYPLCYVRGPDGKFQTLSCLGRDSILAKGEPALVS